MQNEKGYTLAGKKLFIGLPAYDFKVTIRLAISLARLAQYAPAHGIEIQIGSVCGCSVVSRARNLLVKDFLESDCTELMFIDADINFEAQDVLRLLAWLSENEKMGIAAGVPAARKMDKTYIATLDHDDGDNVTMNPMGLVRAKHVATAFMMIKREVLEKMVEVHPEWNYWDTRSQRTLSCVFDFKLEPEGYKGEDFLFCDRTRELGYEVWIDPTIKLGHMGVHEFEGDFGNDILYPMINPIQGSKVA